MTKHEAICTLSLMATELVGELAGTDSDESNAKLLKRYIDSVNMAISALRQHDVTDTNVGKKMTNADRIRAMSDEELARNAATLSCPKSMRPCKYVRCKDCWLEWLQQPAEEEKA